MHVHSEKALSIFVRVFSFAVLLLQLGWANAQDAAADYPRKPIRLIVPYPAGGGSDVVGRLIGAKLSGSLGQPVIVENKPGASGTIGANFAAKAPPDGLTILLGATPLVQVQAFYKDLPYDTFRDLLPVARVALSADVFAVPASLGVSTLDQFVARIAAEPGKHNYGSYGNATSSHMHGELLKLQKKLDLVHVPYKGGAPLVQDFLGMRLTSMFSEVVTMQPHLANPRIRVLAVSGEKRMKMLPNVPTFTELGYKDFEPNGWYGVLVPAGTPQAVVNRLSREMQRIMEMPDVLTRIEELGLQPAPGNAEDLGEWMRRDAAIWSRVARQANIVLE
jgi:tripartite-type tricarboxylate transporter receptor subunit TctC